jgi:hypothetical protein
MDPPHISSVGVEISFTIPAFIYRSVNSLQDDETKIAWSSVLIDLRPERAEICHSDKNFT